MTLILFLIFIFALVTFAYTFIKLKKRKRNYKSALDQHKELYRLAKSRTTTKKDNHQNYSNYVTKYNSQIDYINPEDIKEG